MCPACLGAAAVTALKIAAASGLTAYGVKKVVTFHQAQTNAPEKGSAHAASEDRHV